MMTIRENRRITQPLEIKEQELLIGNKGGAIVQSKPGVKLYLAEEQQFLREAYLSFFSSHPGIEVVGYSENTNAETLIGAAAICRPTVALLGVKVLTQAAVEQLAEFKEAYPEVSLVLLSASYDVKGIKALREFSRGSMAGCAFLLKHTIDTVDQLTQVIYSVSEGRMILDPAVMEGLISSNEPFNTFLRDLSPREMEVLSWMAKGYRNNTIAEVLCLEPKTVERHINSIYSKVGNCPESKHPRVYAISLYLKAAGLLNSDHSEER